MGWVRDKTKVWLEVKGMHSNVKKYVWSMKKLSLSLLKSCALSCALPFRKIISR